MKQTRTIFGLLIMILFAVPILFGVIWAVGFTQAVVSQKTLSQLPGEIIAEIPELLDGMMLAARDENSDMDYDTRTWLNAMAGAGTAPKDVMKETGLSDWLQKELTGSLATIGDILNGRSAARDVWLDMRPLKAASATRRWKTGGPGDGKAAGLHHRAIRRPGNRSCAVKALMIPCLPAARCRAGKRRRPGHPRAHHPGNPRPGQHHAKLPVPARKVQCGQDRDLVHLPAVPDPGRLHRPGGAGGRRSTSHFFRWSGATNHGRRRAGPGDVLPGQGGHPLGHAHRPGLLILLLEPIGKNFRRPCRRPGPGGFAPFHFAGDRRGRGRLHRGIAAVRLFLHLHPRK